ncbi:glycogen debranching protein [Prolixibacteraceae bacterium JC049]|nr:glycogen debranching protein [Prolixibacteraceae bacterium JC049]
MKKVVLFISVFCFAFTVFGQSVLYKSDAFSVYKDRVEQRKYTSKAVSNNTLHSDYQSPANAAFNPEIEFKFSLNGNDNELAYGVNHQAVINPNKNGLAVIDIEFGKLLKLKGETSIEAVPANTKVLFRLNLKPVIDALNKDGYYNDIHGKKMFKADFKGVYIAGGNTPLSWDFENLPSKKGMELTDEDGDGIYETTLIFNAYNPAAHTSSEWSKTADLEKYPTLNSPSVLMDALYNMSLEEMLADIRDDRCFMAGKEWTGVWTRDISYSIVLAMAAIEPEVAKNSLMRKVKNDRIIQDTGTGGSWPVSTDRVTWALAAWEVYKVTGKQEWLQKAYDIIRNSIEEDLKTAVNPVTGLFYGESSFLDWRKQTYPKWMDPKDIYLSQTLGTNVVFYQTLQILGEMGKLLKVENDYSELAEKLKVAINKELWLPADKFYAQFIYGRKKQVVSPRAEALGEALAVLFDVADKNRAAAMMKSVPVMDYGIPCIYPQIAGIPPYHNKAIWPFVQAYWTWAGAKSKNSKVVEHGMASMMRQAALFLTNKENMTASNGDFNGTALNSDRQLWSVGGQLAMVYRVIFGMEFKSEGLHFKPFVPKAYNGEYQLNDFQYRKANLNITVKGFGNGIKHFLVDGKKQKEAVVADELIGKHTIEIVLNGKMDNSEMNMVASSIAPDYPRAKWNGNQLTWNKVANATSYKVFKNGKLFKKTSATKIIIEKNKEFVEYQVLAVDAKGRESFLSEPVEVQNSNELWVEAEKFADTTARKVNGFKGEGATDFSLAKNRTYKAIMTVSDKGTYSIDARYANGNGPVNTDNKCGIRSLYVNGKYYGVMVFPQRGSDEWSNWGMSSPIEVTLNKGENIIELKYEDFNRNMNEEVNEFLLDSWRVVKL